MRTRSENKNNEIKAVILLQMYYPQDRNCKESEYILKYKTFD